MVGVVVGMCVYMCHPPAPLFKSFFIRANLLGFFFKKKRRACFMPWETVQGGTCNKKKGKPTRKRSCTGGRDKYK